MTGFPYPAVDPMLFLVDDEIKEFEDDQRYDLLGTGRNAVEQLSTGVFVVHTHVVPKDTCEVILNVFPHCWARTNPGTASESWTLLDPMLVAGFVLFDCTKVNTQPLQVSHSYNVPTVEVSPNNVLRTDEKGTSFLSADNPMMRNIGLRNTLGAFYLPAKTIFRVTFRLAPLTASAAVPPGIGIPNPFTIGANAAPVGPKRIDGAGAYVSGLRMPQQLYDKLKKARQNGKLGSEAQGRLGVRGG